MLQAWLVKGIRMGGKLIIQLVCNAECGVLGYKSISISGLNTTCIQQD